MSAIPASSVSLKTMADGTLRIAFDIDPANAQDAFRLFAAPGTQVAIAALLDGSFLEQKPETEAPAPVARAHMGDACYRTVRWCQEPAFWDFLNRLNQRADPFLSRCVVNAIQAGDMVKELCGVESRKELDTDSEANKAWNRLIREPYRLYLQSQKEFSK